MIDTPSPKPETDAAATPEATPATANPAATPTPPEPLPAAVNRQTATPEALPEAERDTDLIPEEIPDEAFDAAFIPEEIPDEAFDAAFIPEEIPDAASDPAFRPEAFPVTARQEIPLTAPPPAPDPAEDAGLPEESLEAVSHAARLLASMPESGSEADEPLSDPLPEATDPPFPLPEPIPNPADGLLTPSDPMTDWIHAPEPTAAPMAHGEGTIDPVSPLARELSSATPSSPLGEIRDPQAADDFLSLDLAVRPTPFPEADPYPRHVEPPPPREEVMEMLEEDLEPDPPSREWWIIPLVAALLLFLAGIGAGRYLIPPWARDTTPQTGVKPTVVTMAGPMAPSPEAQSGNSDKSATMTDAGSPLSVNPSSAKPENTPTPAVKAEESPAPSGPPGTDADLQNPPTDPAKTTTAPGETSPPTDSATAQPTSDNDGEIDLQYEESLPHEPVTLPPPQPAQQKREGARVAVVIDDLGYNVPVSLAIARLPHAVTLAILPGGDGSRQVATIGKSTHKDIILHQPMEPMGYPRIKPGPGALLMGMGADEIRPVLKHNLDKFPEAIGINNHMGSRITQYRPAMDTVMEVLKERGLFFLDSRTSQTSVAFARAKNIGIPAARRDVFLDNIQRVSAIEARLAELEHIARVTGQAIGIGHPYRETLTALQHWLPAATKRGIQVEGLSHFLTPGESRPRTAPETRREQPDKATETDKSFKLKSETSLVKPTPSGGSPAAHPRSEPPLPIPTTPPQPEPSTASPQPSIPAPTPPNESPAPVSMPLNPVPPPPHASPIPAAASTHTSPAPAMGTNSPAPVPLSPTLAPAPSSTPGTTPVAGSSSPTPAPLSPILAPAPSSTPGTTPAMGSNSPAPVPLSPILAPAPSSTPGTTPAAGSRSPTPAPSSPALIPPITSPIVAPAIHAPAEPPQSANPVASPQAAPSAPVKAPPSASHAKSPPQTPTAKKPAATPTSKKPAPVAAQAKKPAPAPTQTKKPAVVNTSSPSRTPAVGHKPATAPGDNDQTWTAPPVLHDPLEYVLPVDPNP
ncbi:MAG: divergent polysaccharide deacetylase family protein [Magnetococcales bacterium]|nr:divergent polysaccharide deacetylase family protein [Magnetococcales bacterium]